MIAPVREPRDPTERRSGGLTMARRAVAAVLFGQTAEPSPPARVAATTAWLWVAWVAAIAVSYFAFAAWWTIDLY